MYGGLGIKYGQSLGAFAANANLKFTGVSPPPPSPGYDKKNFSVQCLGF